MPLTGGKNKQGKYGRLNFDGKLADWIKLCGIYFRFPTEDYKDIYWDDDYEEGISFKSWLRKKYTGPYNYNGKWEHYHKANQAARDLLKNYPDFKCATIEDFQYGFEVRLDELLERIPIINLLAPQGIVIDESIYKRVSELCSEHEKSTVDLSVLPVSDEIIYDYDYGDGWEVSIKMSDCYYATIDEQIKRLELYNYEAINHDLSNAITSVIVKNKPVCIELDGLPVMDDVGGIHGYIDFLKKNRLSLPPERDEIRQCAKYMGWTGRMSKAEKLL